MLKMTTKMVPKYIFFANIVIIWLEIYGKYYFIHVQTYKEFSTERLILLYKSYIFKMVPSMDFAVIARVRQQMY